MKKYIASIVAVMTVFVFAVNCTGQTIQRLVADIPFDFQVGKEKLPSGRYAFEPANRLARPSAMTIRSLSKSDQTSITVSILLDEPVRQGQDLRIMFQRYGSVHYLSSIHLDVDDLGFKLFKTSEEKNLAKQFDRSPVNVRSVAVGN
jgi:hypothetical protein